MSRTVELVRAIAVTTLLVSCGGGGGGSGSARSEAPACEESFAGTFEAIQKTIFERHGCTQEVCHGNAAQGGLDLSPAVAYRNLLEVPSSGSADARIEPGSPGRSYLFQKLAAGANPGSVQISGAAMPNGLPPLSEGELEAVRIWIKAGAPETGTVGDPETGGSKTIGELLGACLPDADPITIKPLDPPPPDEGVQFIMPQYVLPAGKEVENCFATYYDFTGQVPSQFQDPTGTYFRWVSTDMRQDPQSHHLVLYVSGVSLDQVHHPSYGRWACSGGERDGEECEPTDLASCGSGMCMSEPKPFIGCFGYGPGAPALGMDERSLMDAQGVGGGMTSQLHEEFQNGVFAEIPMRGIFHWNSHAFNLTTEPHRMNARINFMFASVQQYPLQRIPTDLTSLTLAAGTQPFTTRTVCNDYVIPQGARLIELTSHTHKRGKHFFADGPDGTRLYENFIYSDPVYQRFEPPLEFDSAEPAARTIHYCGLFNNGVAEDGSPDPETVTRASRMSDRASCQPVACASGRIGAPCNGTGDDATCDSAPGAGDGHCDACAITAGVTTENEMFLLFGWYYFPN